MKPKGSFLFNLLNKKITIGSIETDVATVGLLIYSSLLLITPFLVSTLFVGVMSLLFGVLVSLWWGLRGGIVGGFWVTGSVILSFWLNPAVSDLGKMIVNLSIVFLVCIILGKISDFTREKQTKLEKVNQELQRQKKWRDALFENSTEAIVLTDDNHLIIDVNDKFKEIFQYGLQEVRGKNITEVIEKDADDNSDQNLLDSLLAGEKVKLEGRRYDKKGTPLEVLIKGVPIIIDEQVVGAYIMYEDITEQKKTKEKIRYVSFHDELTGLYNRAYVEEEIKRLDTKRQLPISIIILDLNGLKLVNDTFGHEAGDKVLVKTAEALQRATRKEDIIARFGGDEFIIFLPQTAQEEVKLIRKRIIKSFEDVSQTPVSLSAASGAATKEEPEQDIWKIIKKADARMYENKLMEDKNRKNNIIKELLNRLQEQSGENLLHTMHMQKLAFELGSAIDLSFYELDRLALLVTLHDIGKVTIPARTLTKPDSLTNREWQSIKDHPKTGYRIASATKEFAHIAQEILYHHEHWGGSGYPEGLRGSKIPLLSRIVAIVDAYEVMSSGRPYKEAITKDECKQELIEKAGTQFDPKLVDIFVELLE